MKMKLLFVAWLLMAASFPVNAQKTSRYIAVTIDDLPVVAVRTDIETRREITTKLLKHITDAKVPAIGFVNENKLYDDDGKRDESEVDLLRQWLAGGLDLGNHTFSHIALNSHTLEEYEADLLHGEIITKELLQGENKQIRYFRHPYLSTGKTIEDKKELAIFLAQHGYTIAPVTFDNDDYVFAAALDSATGQNDQKLAERVGKAYLVYIKSKAIYWERKSVKLFGREIKQIMLVHANSINAEHFGAVIKILKKRGYKFITLQNALTDKAYKLPDIYVGNAGFSWFHRWALAKNKKYNFDDEPDVPDFVAKEAEKVAN